MCEVLVESDQKDDSNRIWNNDQNWIGITELNQKWRVKCMQWESNQIGKTNKIKSEIVKKTEMANWSELEYLSQIGNGE